MGLIDTLAKRMGYSKTRPVENISPWARHYAEGEVFNMPDPSVYGVQADYYRKMSWIASAVEIRAQSCASVEFDVYQVSGEDESAIINHEFEQLLFKPNPLESRFEFLEAWFSYRILTGNGYAWLNRSGPDEPPSEIWSIPSNMIIPVPDGRMFLKGYLFTPGDGSEIPLEPYEIVHLKRFNPHNKYLGLSPVEAIAQSANLDLARMNQETKQYAQNNGRLPAILTFPEPIPDPEWKSMQKEIDDKANKMRNYLMLRNTKSGVGFIQTAISPQDAQFIESRTFTKEEMYNLFAPGLASMLAINATEANAKSGKATFSDYAVYPLLESGAQKITNDVLPAYGPSLRGRFKDTRAKDRALELQELFAYSQTHTVEEVRLKYYRDKPLGDERDKLFPAQVTAVAAPAPEQPPAVANEKPSISEQFSQMPPTQIPVEEQPEVEEAQVESVDEIPALSQKAWKELEIWKWKVCKAVKAGQPATVDFAVKEIPNDLALRIDHRLKAVKTVEEAKAVFESCGQPAAEPKEEPGDEAHLELKHWEQVAVKCLKEKKPLREFEPSFIQPALAGAISGALESARNVFEVRSIFANAAEWRNYP